ncbi:MAG: hypothetical protein HYT87_19585 [Nitrospirae bacterium]|nr:hypothetical protein [Nitrospirota bacterium]
MKRVILFSALLPLILGAVWACSPKARWKVLNTLFDAVPPPEEKADKSKTPAPPKAASRATLENQSRTPPKVPGIPAEKLSDWKQVEELLPKDDSGGVDWVAALREGIIEPWAGLTEDAPPKRDFGFDFIYKAESKDDDAVFFHSSHAEWLACNNCHPAVFEGFDFSRGELNMDAVDEGKYCGRCHGTVAFPRGDENCTRCHPNQ